MIFDGDKAQREIAQVLRKDIQRLPIHPRLAILLVGEDPASNIYVERKRVFGKAVGCRVDLHTFPAIAQQKEILAQIRTINADSRIHGCILQLPVPKPLSQDMSQEISLKKDVDGLTPHSPFTPATARAILWILDAYGITIKGANVVVVGRGRLVGKPIAVLLKARGGRVRVCHSKTSDLTPYTARADILVVAVGKPNLIRPNMVREGSVVINVGGTLGPDGQLHGDVDPNVARKTKLFTPVPGGVGPITVAMLFQNLIDAVTMQTRKIHHSPD